MRTKNQEPRHGLQIHCIYGVGVRLINNKKDLLPSIRTPTSKFKTFMLEREVGGRLSITGCNCYDVRTPT